MLKKLIDQNEDIVVIGYGQSGSGKTSTLIYFNKGKKDGILIERLLLSFSLILKLKE